MKLKKAVMLKTSIVLAIIAILIVTVNISLADDNEKVKCVDVGHGTTFFPLKITRNIDKWAYGVSGPHDPGSRPRQNKFFDTAAESAFKQGYGDQLEPIANQLNTLADRYCNAANPKYTRCKAKKELFKVTEKCSITSNKNPLFDAEIDTKEYITNVDGVLGPKNMEVRCAGDVIVPEGTPDTPPGAYPAINVYRTTKSYSSGDEDFYHVWLNKFTLEGELLLPIQCALSGSDNDNTN